MRRVYSADDLGPVFWLGKEVPKGYEHFGYPTYLDDSLNKEIRADAASYLAALIDTEPKSDWGKPNERTLYELPADRRRLIALLRSGGELPGEPPVGQHMLTSTCVPNDGIPPSPIPSPETYHVCRPGTGLYNVGLPGDRMPSDKIDVGVPLKSTSNIQDRTGPWPGYHPVPVGRHCNWTAPQVTNIPDSHSRACTAPLPDGSIFMIGAQITKGRDPVVLSWSKDGLVNHPIGLLECHSIQQTLSDTMHQANL